MTDLEIDLFINDMKTPLLRDFSAPSVPRPYLSHKGYRVNRSAIPVPELVRLVLLLVLRLSVHGPEEKVRWTIDFRYKGYSCAFSLQKSGLYLYISVGDGPLPKTEQVAFEIVKKIQRTISRAEKILLAPLAREQIETGNFTIANQYHVLANRYTYFRKKAEKAAKPRRKPRTKPIKSLAESLGGVAKVNNELLYNTIAMLDAYFSFLEHLFVLVAPLCQDSIRLVDFIEDLWTDKYKALFDIRSNPRAKSFYDQLGGMKKRFRNFYAHGAFEKKGASFYIHIPNIGAIPAQFSEIKNSITFDFFPVEEDSFADICRIIDTFEEWLKSADSGVARAMKYVESGLDVPCDKASVERTRLAMESDKTLDALIAGDSYLWAMHANMDY